jgi:hypothetical protein
MDAPFGRGICLYEMLEAGVGGCSFSHQPEGNRRGEHNYLRLVPVELHENVSKEREDCTFYAGIGAGVSSVSTGCEKATAPRMPSRHHLLSIDLYTNFVIKR